MRKSSIRKLPNTSTLSLPDITKEREKAHKLDCQVSSSRFFASCQGKKIQICSISECYVTINHANRRGLERNTSRVVSNANKGKKRSR